jgi:hypothetical protein
MSKTGVYAGFISRFREKNMKKLGLIFWCVLLAGLTGCKKEAVSPIPEIAQGYGEVKFGSSVETVRQAYGIGEDVELAANKNDANLTTLTQKEVSETIIERRFLFNGGKLYEVDVFYPRKVNFEQILGTLAEKYGPAGDRVVVGIGISSNGINGDKQYAFQKYLPDLVVRANFYEAHSSYWHKVEYYWWEFVHSYELSKTGQIEL